MNEEQKARRKIYREANKEKINARRKIYYEKNKEKIKEQSKAQYHKHKDKSKLQRQLWAQNNPEKMNKYKTAWREKNRHRTHRDRARLKYGITSSEYDTLIQQSGPNCPICGVLFDWDNRHKGNRPCIDHCHKNGTIRGLICGRCNAAIGQFNDNIELLEKAIQWLKNPQLPLSLPPVPSLA